jgi:mannobiose 2-epimerase
VPEDVFWRKETVFPQVERMPLAIQEPSKLRWQPCALVLALSLLAACGGSSESSVPRPAEIAPRLQKILLENVVPFWLARSLDSANGGYTINFDVAGKPNGQTSKGLVVQTRMIWFWSRLARSGLAEPTYQREQLLEAADLGYRFLRDKMWDAEHGGFYWEVDVSGNQPLRADKHLYGQAFALYALAEYSLARGDQESLDLALRLFDLIETKAHDERYGGYRESFHADWTMAGEDALMNVPARLKTMNTHLHLLEALTTLLDASHSPRVRERLLELVTIQSNTVIRRDLVAATDRYERDWTPLAGDERVAYGHDLENLWLLMAANRSTGTSNHLLLDLYKSLFDHSLRYGLDRGQGGFYRRGAFHRRANERAKVWWVQAEALIASLWMYEFTGQPLYWDTFLGTLDFIEKYQVDWKNGEWHANVDPGGSVYGDKADIWKAAYHNGRAMIECLEALERLEARDDR